MKKIFIMPLVLCLSMSVSATDKQESKASQENQFRSSVNTVKISLKPELVGLWGMEMDKKNQCVEYYNFKSNNELVVKSGKEWTTSFYEYEPMVDMDDQINILTIQVNYDNNEIDCSGDQVNQTGELSQYNVKWKTPKTIEFCSTEQKDQCFATLNRVLP